MAQGAQRTLGSRGQGDPGYPGIQRSLGPREARGLGTVNPGSLGFH